MLQLLKQLAHTFAPRNAPARQAVLRERMIRATETYLDRHLGPRQTEWPRCNPVQKNGNQLRVEDV